MPSFLSPDHSKTFVEFNLVFSMFPSPPFPSKGEDPYAPPPLPPYLESLPSPPDMDSGMGVFDTCYHLLRLYCSRDHSLELTLGPSASTPFQLDYRLRYGNGH